MSSSRTSQPQQGPGREARCSRVRRTIRQALDAGMARIEETVGSVSAQLAGRATRPLAVVPVRVQSGPVPRAYGEIDGYSPVWVVPPSTTRRRQG
ncbi:MAG: hypothetical protein ACREFO_04080 [Acetobacteraceae bacterium]